jgi:hypothetical protein
MRISPRQPTTSSPLSQHRRLLDFSWHVSPSHGRDRFVRYRRRVEGAWKSGGRVRQSRIVAQDGQGSDVCGERRQVASSVAGSSMSFSRAVICERSCPCSRVFRARRACVKMRGRMIRRLTPATTKTWRWSRWGMSVYGSMPVRIRTHRDGINRRGAFRNGFVVRYVCRL